VDGWWRIRLANRVRKWKWWSQLFGTTSVRLVGCSGVEGKHLGTDQETIDSAFRPSDDPFKDETTSAGSRSYFVAHGKREGDRLLWVPEARARMGLYGIQIDQVTFQSVSCMPM
jgi:hypothetical protein